MSLFAQSIPRLSQCLTTVCSDQHCLLPERAMARNLLVEHRVSQGRFDSFASRITVPTPDPLTLRHIQDALFSHQNDVRVTLASKLHPAYELPHNNGNRIANKPGLELCTVIDLTAFAPVFVEAGKALGLKQFRNFDTTASGDEEGWQQVNSLLSDGLSDPAVRDEFMSAVLTAISWYRQNVETKIRPTWAAEWTSIQPYLNPANPGRWLQSVGVPKERSIWLALVRYTLAPNVKLYRPTQLDAGWYAHHFPSPPQSAPEKGGFTMDLRDGEPETTEDLVTEYIHRQIDFTLDHWKASGSLVGFVPAPDQAKALHRLRERHWVKLSQRFQGVTAWMESPL